MRSKANRVVDDLGAEDGIAESPHRNVDTLETCKEFVLRSIDELVESDLGVLHQQLDKVQRLYLVTGEVYRLSDSGVTRLS
jgi:hypothetical protein